MKIKYTSFIFTCVLVLGMTRPFASAQAPGVQIENDDILIEDAPLVSKARELKEAGRLMGIKQVTAALKSPTPAALVLPDVSTKHLEPRAIAELGRKALVRVGWFYLDKKAKKWHVNLADGYAITTDGAVATCYHCVSPKEQEDMTQGFLVAFDPSGNILPVTGILARDKEMDVAIIRVQGDTFTPLPLNDQTAPGDTVYVFSDPMSILGYFSSGLLNRFFWLDGKHSTDATKIEGARNLRIHVSTDWAPGSSGAAIIDVCGNAIGHVSVIESLGPDDPPPVEEKPLKHGKKSPKSPPPPPPPSDNSVFITLHEAVPARGVKMLVESMNAAKPAAAPGAK